MPTTSAARDRLLATASEMFYARGIAATGVDTVVRAAGVSKPTLYAHFPSKSELVTAVLERRHAERVESLDRWLDAVSADPLARLRSVFGWVTERYLDEGVHGCVFLKAAAEAPDPHDPVRVVVREHKHWLRDRLAALARDAGLDAPDRLGAQLLLLLDGLSSRVVAEAEAWAVRQAAEQARSVADLLIAAAAHDHMVPQ